MSTTIRVKENTRDRLAKLAKSTGQPMAQLIDQAADMLERKIFFDQLSSRFEELNQDSFVWKEIIEERDVENATLDDHSK